MRQYHSNGRKHQRRVGWVAKSIDTADGFRSTQPILHPRLRGRLVHQRDQPAQQVDRARRTAANVEVTGITLSTAPITP